MFCSNQHAYIRTRFVGKLWQSIALVAFLCLCVAACFSPPEPDELPPATIIAATATTELATEETTAVSELPPTAAPNTSTPTVVNILKTAVPASPTPTTSPIPDPPEATATMPPIACQSRSDWSPYTVQVRDTLFAIAQRTSSTVADLQQGNCLANADRIEGGQQLFVPVALPTVPSATAPTATETAVSVPTIHSFSLISDEQVGDRRHITLAWEISAGNGFLIAGTAQRFAPWVPVEETGTHTFELYGTHFENPPVTLTVQPLTGEGQSVSQSITLAWPCEFSYFFGFVPNRCPQAEAATTQASYQLFENGRMVWLEITDTILVIYHDGTWKRYDDIWQEGDPPNDPSIQPPDGLFQPIRGFGEVWRNQNQHDGVRDRLGWGLAPEQATPATWQHAIAESVGQGTLYFSLAAESAVYELTGYDVNSGSWSILSAP